MISGRLAEIAHCDRAQSNVFFAYNGVHRYSDFSAKVEIKMASITVARKRKRIRKDDMHMR